MNRTTNERLTWAGYIARAGIVMLFAMVGGCGHSNVAKSTTAPTITEFKPTHVTKMDAAPDPSLVVQVSVYRILVPAKFISHNEEFWKHVTEDTVDIGTHDLLFANGFRVGIAPRWDWDYFKQIIEANNVVSQMMGASGASGAPASVLEMPLKSKVLKQLITYFHPTNGLIGQMYDRCDDSLVIRFEPVPRSPGSVRLNITPVLRADRTELMYTIRDEVQELNFVHPQYLFDMKLSVDVPIDHFLILAPSPDADFSTSLGRTFLYQDGEGQQFEQMLIISPQPFQLEKKPTSAPSTPK